MIFDKNKIKSFNPNIKEVIAKNISRIRKDRKITQEELAYYSDISYDFMRRIESGKGKFGFSIQTLYKLAIVLECSIDELMDESTIKEEVTQ